MMEFKGTKGKWRVYRNSQGYNSFYINLKYRLIPEKEEYANALLISKAPEMLEALHRCVKGNITAYEINKLIKEATEI